MNYNVASMISLVITALLALLVANLVSSYFFSETGFEEISKLIVAIMFLLSFYAPIKVILLKYMDIKDDHE